MHWVLVMAQRTFDLCCGMWDLAPQTGIEPRPPALGSQSLSYRPPGQFPEQSFQLSTVPNSTYNYLLCQHTAAELPMLGGGCAVIFLIVGESLCLCLCHKWARAENLGSHKSLYRNVYSSLICNSLNWKHPDILQRMSHQTVLCTCYRMDIISNEREWTFDTCDLYKFQRIYTKGKNVNADDHKFVYYTIPFV